MSAKAPPVAAPMVRHPPATPWLQRQPDPGGLCPQCAEEGKLHREPSPAGGQAHGQQAPLPPVVNDVLAGQGQPLDRATRSFFESRLAHDFGKVRVHSGAQAADSARSLGARAWTTGRDVVFGAGEYRPSTQQGLRLLAHELTHVVQQGNSAHGPPQGVSQPADPSEREADQVADQVMQARPASMSASAQGDVLHRAVDEPQKAAGDADDSAAATGGETVDAGPEGFEIDPGQLMLMPHWREIEAPGASAGPTLHRQALSPAGRCDTPSKMQAVTSGTFFGSKTMDEYYPDLIGQGFWGSKDSAGTFDTGKRAGSAVQLIGTLPIPCASSTAPTTLGQSATIVRAKANGAQMMENGKPLAGQTLDDIKRSTRDQSRAPFRQTWVGAVSMADPISGIPYNTLSSYEWEVNLTTTLTGAGGSVSAGWGVTVEASGGKVTKNEVR